MNINDLRDGQRHDRWVRLQDVRMGKIHLAVTILEKSVQVPFFFRKSSEVIVRGLSMLAVDTKTIEHLKLRDCSVFV